MGMKGEHLQHLEQLDSWTLREIMVSYGQEVWNYAYFLTKSFHLADDITQDVFLSVYRNIGSYRSQCTLKTWLFTITRNTAINYRRSAFFRKVIPVGWVKETRAAPSVEQDVMSALLANEVWEMVLTLPAKHREVLILDAKYELTANEIAAILGVSEGTVKSRLSRARKKVSELWERRERE